MKIYLVSVEDPHQGNCLYWCETEIDQDIAVLEKTKAHGVRSIDCDTYEYDIKPTRKSFIEFLNIHFTRDNG